MSDQFIEEQISGLVRFGSSYCDEYKVKITTTASGSEYRQLVHGIPTRYYMIGYVTDADEIGSKFLDLYHRCYGSFAGFRVKIGDDFTTAADNISAPAAFDHQCSLVSAGVYQIQKRYGGAGSTITIGRPIRTIFKPVTGTVLCGIKNATTGNHTQTAFTVDTTNGRITFSANKTGTITGVSQATSAVITLGTHSFVTGDSVYVSGVSGMTEINAQRATVTAYDATTITININSSGYTAYTSGGTVNTRPQGSETVWAGCEFDVPMRFNTKVEISIAEGGVREAQGIELVELLNP